MSKLSQYQSVFRVAKHDGASDGIASKAAKRNRQPVSCQACRPRKLKCDRQLPCEACSKRGEAASCTYASDGQSVPSRREEKSSDVQLRLQKLEEMISGLVQVQSHELVVDGNGRPARTTTAEEHLKELSVDEALQTPSQPPGYLDVNGSKTSYKGATHWSMILENIRDIKDALDNGPESSPESSPDTLPDVPDLVFDINQRLTIADVLASLPSRPTVDYLLSFFFNSRQVQSPFIHKYKFLREYESFWADPSSTSLVWISMLFSILHIGELMNTLTGNDGNYSPPKVPFFTRAGQALVAGKYHKGVPYSVEASLMYSLCKYRETDDLDPDAWMICGISARLALRMGYHRDPRHLPNLSPFEGEMRRRTFSMLQVFELLLSFQAGLPPIVHEEECDVEDPSYLLDEDFDEDCKSLPPSRPASDAVPVQFYCHKARLATLFRRIVRHALSPKTTLYEDTMKLDRELRETVASLPPSLQWRSLNLSFIDQQWSMTHRLNVEMLYRKSLCVLHRKYLSRERRNPLYDYSRKTSSDAALQLLKLQHEFYLASQPNGQLQGQTWMISSLTLHDFLLAAMSVCLDLYESHKQSVLNTAEDLKAQAEKYDALTTARDIWVTRKSISNDAIRASNVLAVMLAKIPRPKAQNTTVPSHAIPVAAQLTTDSSGAPETSIGALSRSLDNIPAFDISNVDLAFDDTDPLNLESANSLNSMFNTSDSIDWIQVDQYLYGRGDASDAVPEEMFTDNQVFYDEP